MDALKKLRISGRKSLVPGILKQFGKGNVPQTDAVLVKKVKPVALLPAPVVEPKAEVVVIEKPEVLGPPVDKVKKTEDKNEEPKVEAPVVVVNVDDNKPFFDVYDLLVCKADMPAKIWAKLETMTVGQAKALFVKYEPFIKAAMPGFVLEDYRRK